MRVRFEAEEYCEGGELAACELEFAGSAAAGWQVRRNGQPHLRLGPGYRLLRSLACGVCGTDLARHHLPFPLPQVTGHEVVAADERGQRYAVEINASHRARGVDDGDCAFCRAGLDKHCPERLVLGIHDLPGGFGRFLLAPVDAAVPLPDSLPTDTAVLLEPFAAALHAVEEIAPRHGDTVAVLGPGRLGLLVIAALRADAERRGVEVRILALGRRPEALARAAALGATETELLDRFHHAGGGGHRHAGRGGREQAGGEGGEPIADVVVDTTGNPAGLQAALRLARREVHCKSTHGQPSCGLAHLTEMVVDELGLARLDPAAPPIPAPVGAAEATKPGGVVDLRRGAAADAALRHLEESAVDALPRASAVIAATAAQVDAAVRPQRGRDAALLQPGGTVWVDPACDDPSPLLGAVAQRGLRLSASRCGDLRAALAVLQRRERLRDLGAAVITHRLAASELAAALSIARSQRGVKAVVSHADAAP